jgi:hypothetical protein
VGNIKSELQSFLETINKTKTDLLLKSIQFGQHQVLIESFWDEDAYGLKSLGKVKFSYKDLDVSLVVSWE